MNHRTFPTYDDYREQVNKYMPGWAKIALPVIDRCESDKIVICQIKEKFGGLRIYTDINASEDLYVMIDRAESDSLTVCMKCGKPGQRNARGTGWLLTLCEEHHKEREERRAGL